MNTPAVLLLIFNRPDETRRVFEMVRKAKPKKLFIATDAPREGKEQDKILCRETLEVVKNVDWDCEVERLSPEKNVGSYLGITSAITWFFEHVEEGIILEDDCVPNQSFFDYAGMMLEKYRDEEKIGIISGNNFVPKNILEEWDPDATHYHFTHTPYTWGYATWKRVWNKFDPKLISWPIMKKEGLMNKIYPNKNVAGLFSDYFDMLYDGRYKLYDTTLFYSSLANNMLCIIPPRNLVTNIGAIGIRSTEASHVNNIPTDEINVSKLIPPATLEANPQIENLIHHFWGYSKFSRRRFLIKILDTFRLHGVSRRIYRKFVEKKE